MNRFLDKKFITVVFAAVAGVLFLAGAALGWYKYYLISEDLKNIERTHEEAQAEMENKLLETENKIRETERELYQSQQDNAELARLLAEEQKKNAAFAEQIGAIRQTVDELVKLKGLDKEILQKYSKIYFLNENYLPKDLSKIDEEFVQNPKKEEYIHSSVLPFLYALLNDAAQEGINLRIISAFRSFTEQAQLKSAYTMTYGYGANKFSADQGYSEHQLGTTIDFTTKELGTKYTNFKNTDAYRWLLANAHKYGFILSYPEGNKYYIFEPWHWRFVGIRLAKELHATGKHFYDMEQREIDNYLLFVFDW